MITSKVDDLGNGWSGLRVGNHFEKSRSERTADSLLKKNYPDYSTVSTFDETSFHSGRNHPGKVHKYGTNKYNLEFSTFKKEGKSVELINPVRTQRKQGFGNTVDKIQFHRQEYVVINWEPADGSENLWVEHSRENPLTKEKNVVFKSGKFDKSESDKVIKIFRERVEKVK